MKRIIVVSVVMMLLVAIAAQAQTAPTPEHKKMGVWVGDWTEEGKNEATPYGVMAGTTKGTISCEWFEGEYQVVCNGESSELGGKTKSLFILTYSMEKKQYLGLHMTSSGDFSMPIGKVDGSVWTINDSIAAAGKTYQFRVVFNFASADEYTVRAEYSEDGKNWKLAGEGKGVKK